ncbi:hypothetical protein [Pseudomonas sp. PDM13]|uniref:hypothetical protein n=1 Tax=Pseudomonas sp. PDM13 TaxID=2769255 RepID=UPI0021E0D449|nr:hypothetical protein [Pseudomonas sp. PDM13]MCU9950592.1 hypothetical protein [Pseudomonas sp. PDM13]
MSFKVLCGGQRLSVSGHGETYSGLTILLVCLALVACGKERPATHTPEYRAAHGIVEGAANTIEVSGVSFRIPNDVEFDVYSSEDIRPGKADELSLLLFIDQAGIHKGNPVPTARNSRVMVDILKMGDPNGKTYFEAEKEEAETPVARPTLGLIEYPLKGPAAEAEYSGAYVYVPADGPRGNGREFFCSVARPKDPVLRNGDCNAYYYLGSGLQVRVLFEYSALVNWRVIMEAVRREVSGIQM